MKAYELLYFVDPTSSEDVLSAISQRIESTVSADGGKIDETSEWGKRKLAYEVDGLTEGNYILVNFHAAPTQIAELDRVLRINDNVKRHMIVCRAEA